MVKEIQKAVNSFHLTLSGEGLTHRSVQRFRNIIHRFYRKNARDFLLWRKTNNPYHILVSEIMLQQTRIDRVMQKYPLFIQHFPDFRSLAGAQLRSLYAVWHGMGYNRRVLALKNIASIVIKSPYYGTLPSVADELIRLPGIGPATAGAIAAFAFHQPSVFIETNIRRIFIHFFFPDQQNVSDAEILPLVEKTLDKKDPRSWYYALMDFGSMLGNITENPNRKSLHYTKQTPFAGSTRQIRGQILKILMEQPDLTKAAIAKHVDAPGERIERVLNQLITEGFVQKRRNRLNLK